MVKHKNKKKNIWKPNFFSHETMFQFSSMQSDTTVVSIVTVFLIVAIIIIATYGKKTLH